ncbi:hypothetical protein MRX96_018096 [Rhipicephalus microplus]
MTPVSSECWCSFASRVIFVVVEFTEDVSTSPLRCGDEPRVVMLGRPSRRLVKRARSTNSSPLWSTAVVLRKLSSSGELIELIRLARTSPSFLVTVLCSEVLASADVVKSVVASVLVKPDDCKLFQYPRFVVFTSRFF